GGWARCGFDACGDAVGGGWNCGRSGGDGGCGRRAGLRAERADVAVFAVRSEGDVVAVHPGDEAAVDGGIAGATQAVVGLEGEGGVGDLGGGLAGAVALVGCGTNAIDHERGRDGVIADDDATLDVNEARAGEAAVGTHGEYDRVRLVLDRDLE